MFLILQNVDSIYTLSYSCKLILYNTMYPSYTVNVSSLLSVPTQDMDFHRSYFVAFLYSMI